MKLTDREIKESPLFQGEDEVIVYNLRVTPWISVPTNATVKIFSMAGGAKTDTSATNLSGAVNIVDDLIYTPAVTGLSNGVTYRLEIKWVVATNTYEAWATIFGQM